MADAQDLGSCTERCRGSTPLSCILRCTQKIYPKRSLPREDRPGCTGSHRKTRNYHAIPLPCYLLYRALDSVRLASFLLVLATGASADTVWVRSGASAKGLPFPDVKVEKVQGSDIFFVSEGSGRETRRSLDQVSRIQLDDEPAFSAAEEAYEGGNLAGSIDGYRKAIAASNRDWVKTRSGLRLVEAGNKTSNLSASIVGFAVLSGVDPTSAQAHTPVIPANAKKADLDAAIEQVKSASNSGNLTPAQQKPLLTLLNQLYTANKDTASAGKVLSKLQGVDEAAGGGDSADNTKVKAEVKLNDARAAMAAKDYHGVINAIQDNAALFTDPALQNEALFLLAEAKEATAGNDKSALMEAAIAYMRVVANFANQPNGTHVAESLLKTALIEEKLKPEEALSLYKQIATQYKDTPEGKSASENAERLSSTLKKS